MSEQKEACTHGVVGIDCPACEQDRQEEARKKAIAREKAASILGGLRALEQYKLENFKPSAITASAYEAAKNFAPAKDNLYLFGPVGSGKSHLAVAAARQFLDIKGGVLVIKPQQISRKMRSADAAEEERLITSLGSKGVLVIEDIGAEKDTEFMASLLYEVIDYRYMNRPGGLILTSNLSLDDLSGKLHDERISSRLYQMSKLLPLAGEQDHRARR